MWNNLGTINPLTFSMFLIVSGFVCSIVNLDKMNYFIYYLSVFFIHIFNDQIYKLDIFWT